MQCKKPDIKLLHTERDNKTDVKTTFLKAYIYFKDLHLRYRPKNQPTDKSFLMNFSQKDYLFIYS